MQDNEIILCCYVHYPDGKEIWIPEKEYLANNSKPVYKPKPRENSDGTSIEGDVVTCGGNR